MKKFYTILAAAAVALSASAGSLQLSENATVKQLNGKSVSVKPGHEMQLLSLKKVADLDGNKLNPLDKNGDVWTIEGTYVASLGDYYFQTSVGEVEEMVTIETDGSYYYIVPEESESLFTTEAPFTYNVATKTMTFTPLSLGYQSGAGAYAYFAPIAWNNTTNNVDILNSYSVTFDDVNGEIVFDADHGFGWPALTADSVTSELLGWFGLFDVLEMYQEDESTPLDEVQEGQWESIGTAMFTDGWVLPSWGEDPADYPYEVELQRNVNNGNLFRLWEPYKTPDYVLAAYNISDFHGQIVFDITDPAHVVFAAGMPAGYKDDYDPRDQYNFNLLGWQIHGFGDDYEPALHWDLILNFMEENGQPFDTFDAATRTITVTRPSFDFNKRCTSAYSWNANPLPPAKIVLPADYDAGVEGVFVDNDSNAPVEYFNLQGVRVAQPTNGLYIVRQGNNVTKQVVK